MNSTTECNTHVTCPHQALDRAVDACYRKAAFSSDAQRVEFLFERYRQLTSLLPAETGRSKRRK